MTRLFGEYAYSNGPRAGCWWDHTADLPELPRLAESRSCDVAIIGGGFTGLNAALTLCNHGANALVLDAEYPGWGASGRNAGFCCLGGAKLNDAQLIDRYGENARLHWRQTEKAAVDHVASFLSRTGTDADATSQGETWLAHRPRDMAEMDDEIAAVAEDYGVTATVHSADDLVHMGLSAGFYGGYSIPIGFGLNPRKYLVGLLREILATKGQVFAQSDVTSVEPTSRGWLLDVAGCNIQAEKVIVATNGYSSEHVPDWIGGRYMPVQSSVLVTRPLTDYEKEMQGWTRNRMCYDSRNLLHYFRLLPDNRMLFGMRGGLGASYQSETRAMRSVVRHFQRIFPKWRDVELTHYWSGLACLSRDLRPFVGEVPQAPGLYAAFGFHGNGVAMGSYAGHLVASQVLGRDHQVETPEMLLYPPGRYPLGRYRRALMPLAYMAMYLDDL